jgi:hypothetical protein
MVARGIHSATFDYETNELTFPVDRDAHRDAIAALVSEMGLSLLSEETGALRFLVREEFERWLSSDPPLDQVMVRRTPYVVIMEIGHQASFLRDRADYFRGRRAVVDAS